MGRMIFLNGNSFSCRTSIAKAIEHESPDLAGKLIAAQFPKYSSLPIVDVEKQVHDNRTYMLAKHMLICMQTSADYALKVPKGQEILQQLAKRLSLKIAWTYLSGKAREIFISEMNLYQNRWLPARPLGLWKTTFELCQIPSKDSPETGLQKRIIDEVMNA